MPEHYLWVCLFSVTSDKIIIWVSRVGSKCCSPQWKYALFSPLWAWIGGKKKKKRKSRESKNLVSYWLLGWYTCFALRLGFTSSASLAPGPVNWLRHTSLDPWFSGLQVLTGTVRQLLDKNSGRNPWECPRGPQNQATLTKVSIAVIATPSMWKVAKTVLVQTL